MSNKGYDSSTLKTRVRQEFTKSFRSHNGQKILKLDMKEIHKDSKAQVQRLSFGNQSDRPEKVILIMGATGSGKTTLINAMVNYIFGVDYDDSFRLEVIENEDATERSQAESQTDYVTAYSFNHLPGMPQQYNYTLIDTPGFGDSRGIERDQKMVGQLKTFLEEGYGIEQVDAIGIVTPFSTTRLTPTQQYIFDSIYSMFGKDVKEHINIMATFADGSPPPIMETLKKAKVDYQELFKLNNSALFVSTSSAGNGCDRISEHFWEMGMESMADFFHKLDSVSPTSLQMTKDVLKKRIQLKECISDIRNLVHLGLQKLSNLEQERKMLSQFKNIKQNENYEEDFTVLKPQEVVGKMERRDNTFIFFFGQCLSFLSKCINYIGRLFGLDLHLDREVQQIFSYEYVVEKRTIREVMGRRSQAKRDKETKKQVITDISKEIELLGENLLLLLKAAGHLVKELEDIALKPNQLSTPAYIDAMIEFEKTQQQECWKERIEMLMYLKRDAHIMQQGIQVESIRDMTADGIITFLKNYLYD